MSPRHCSWMKLDDGTVVHVQSSQPLAKPCFFCAAMKRNVTSTKLCDFPIAPGKTCDKPMCDYHAVSVGPNLDYCMIHKDEKKP